MPKWEVDMGLLSRDYGNKFCQSPAFFMHHIKNWVRGRRWGRWLLYKATEIVSVS